MRSFTEKYYTCYALSLLEHVAQNHFLGSRPQSQDIFLIFDNFVGFTF